MNSSPYPVSPHLPGQPVPEGLTASLMLEGAESVALTARPSVPPRPLRAGGGVGGQAGPEPPPPTPLLPPVLDVYSYDEDDMVLDPNLAEHLSHFGIDMLKMQKVRPLQILESFHRSLTAAELLLCVGHCK